MNPENERMDRMCNVFYEVVDLASDIEDKTKMVMDQIQTLKTRPVQVAYQLH